MKSFICLATITTAILLSPTVVNAQAYPGATVTTIYVPSIETVTITPTHINPTAIQPDYNSVGTVTTTTTYYGGGVRPLRQHRQYYQQQQVITYPRAVQSSCSTSIIGSPIPSPIALDRSGQPCR
jgi:hypothetical protein